MGGACLCGRDVEGLGDGGPDAGPDGGMLVDAGDAGPDAGDAGPDGGDAGIDCSTTCVIDGTTYCANQQEPSGLCLECIPTQSSTSWSNAPIGIPCKIQHVIPGNHPIGACYQPPVGPEDCSCGVIGSRCDAPTDCCMGTCQDSGITTYCAGEEGDICIAVTIPCTYGLKCCPSADGGVFGTCSSDAGACPG